MIVERFIKCHKIDDDILALKKRKAPVITHFESSSSLYPRGYCDWHFKIIKAFKDCVNIKEGEIGIYQGLKWQLSTGYTFYTDTIAYSDWGKFCASPNALISIVGFNGKMVRFDYYVTTPPFGVEFKERLYCPLTSFIQILRHGLLGL